MDYFRRVFLFLAAGLPGLAVGILINYVFFRLIGLPLAVSYAVALLVQVALNFVILRSSLFRVPNPRALPSAALAFSVGILGFRLLDWALYLLLVSFFHLNFVAAQIVLAGLFSMAKYAYSSWVFLGTETRGEVEQRKSK